MKTCKFEGCNNPLASKGWCTSHYSQFKRHGNTWEIGGKDKRKTFSTDRTCINCHETKDWTLFTLPPHGAIATECKECYRRRLSESVKEGPVQNNNMAEFLAFLDSLGNDVEDNSLE